MQTQPDRSQGGLGQGSGRFGPFPGGTDDDKVVAVANQRSQPASLRPPCLIENMEGDVGQQGGNG